MWRVRHSLDRRGPSFHRPNCRRPNFRAPYFRRPNCRGPNPSQIEFLRDRTVAERIVHRPNCRKTELSQNELSADRTVAQNELSRTVFSQTEFSQNELKRTNFRSAEFTGPFFTVRVPYEDPEASGSGRVPIR